MWGPWRSDGVRAPPPPRYYAVANEAVGHRAGPQRHARWSVWVLVGVAGVAAVLRHSLPGVTLTAQPGPVGPGVPPNVAPGTVKRPVPRRPPPRARRPSPPQPTMWTLGPGSDQPVPSFSQVSKTHASAGRLPITAPMPTLTPEEEKLFSLLREVNDRYFIDAELRVVGGWVRDKLLGRSPNDIDITVLGHAPRLKRRVENTTFLTGADFFYYVQRWLHANDDREFKGFFTIDGTADRSPRRLSVAVGKLCGFEVAITNLWVGGSSTASLDLYEDAIRRDLTINALFYNLHTRQVEDWTRQGLQDLERRVIRTPMSPPLTFDAFPMAPARPLRCIRFACRLNFTLDPGIVQIARTAKVRQDLATRVSRNRIGREVKELVACPDPYRALRLIDACGFRDVILQIHPPANGTLLNMSLLRPIPWDPAPGPRSWEAALEAVRRATHSATYRSADEFQRSALTFASLYHAFIPALDPDAAPSEQFTVLRDWFSQVVAYPFSLRIRSPRVVSRLILAVRQLPALVPLATMDPATDPLKFLALCKELDSFHFFTNDLSLDVVEHFFLCFNDAEGLPIGTVRRFVDDLQAREPLFTMEEILAALEAAGYAEGYKFWKRVARRLRYHQLAYPTATPDDLLASVLSTLWSEPPDPNFF